MSKVKIKKESTFRYTEDNEGHPSIQVYQDGERKTDFEKSWLRMNLSILDLTLKQVYNSAPNENTPDVIEESGSERLTGTASLGNDSIGLISSRQTTSKIDLTIYREEETDSSKERHNKYYLAGYSDDSEHSEDSPPGTYFLNIFLSASRFDEIKSLILSSGLSNIFITIRTGVLPNLYNEYTDGEWPTIFRYLDNRKLLANSDDMPKNVTAKGIVRQSGYECEISFNRRPIYNVGDRNDRAVNFSKESSDVDEPSLRPQRAMPESLTTKLQTSLKPRQSDLSKLSLPIWVFVIIYTIGQLYG